MILCATDAWFILRTNKIHTYVLKKSYLIFTVTKCSVNALMKLAAFSTSNKEGRKEMFYLTTHSTHFIYGYIESDIWLRTILIVRERKPAAPT